MKISVLMAVYNKEKEEYLDKAIESLINQTLKPNEIVIIEDGKLTKELEDVIKKYKNMFSKLIKVYTLKEHVGLGNALKFGIENCENEYIARMDSDDIALKYRLEEQSKFFKMDPTLDLVGGYIEEYDETLTEFIAIRKVPLYLDEIKEKIGIQSPFNHGTVMFKKEAVLKVGNYSDIQFEDYDLWARMLINNCNMMNTNLILGKNRTGYSMYKRRSGIKQINRVLQIEKKLYEYNLINKSTYIKNNIIRSIFALVPVKLKKIIYKKYIRNF